MLDEAGAYEPIANIWGVRKREAFEREQVPARFIFNFLQSLRRASGNAVTVTADGVGCRIFLKTVQPQHHDTVVVPAGGWMVAKRQQGACVVQRWKA